MQSKNHKSELNLIREKQAIAQQGVEVTDKLRKIGLIAVLSGPGELSQAVDNLIQDIKNLKSILDDFAARYSNESDYVESELNMIKRVLSMTAGMLGRKGHISQARKLEGLLIDFSQEKVPNEEDLNHQLGAAQRKIKLGDLQEAQTMIDAIIETARAKNNYYILCKALFAKGDLYSYLEDYPKAIESLDMFEETARILLDRLQADQPSNAIGLADGTNRNMLEKLKSTFEDLKSDTFDPSKITPSKYAEIKADLDRSKMYKARFLGEVHELARARAQYEELITISQTRGLPDEWEFGELTPVFQAQLGNLDIKAGYFESGYRQLKKIEATLSQSQSLAPRMGSFYRLQAHALLNLGNLSSAYEIILKAQNLSEKAQESYVLWQVYKTKAEILEAYQEFPAALQAYSQSIEFINQLMKQPLGFSVDNQYLKPKYEVFTKAISLAIQLEDFETACHFMEMVKSRTLTHFLRTKNVAASDIQDQLIKEYQELEKQLIGLEYTITKTGQGVEEAEQLRNQKEQLLEKIKVQNPRWHQLSAGIELDFDQIRYYVEKNSCAILNLYYGDDQVHMICISKSGIHHASSKFVGKWLQEISDSERSDQQRNIGFSGSVWQGKNQGELKHLIPAHILEEVIQHDSLIIVPHAKLHNVPWAMIEYKDKKLFELIPFAILPNLNAFLIQMDNLSGSNRAELTSVSLFGAPTSQIGKTVDYLSFVKQEILDIEQIINESGSDVQLSAYVDEKCTVNAFVQELSRAHSIFHVACHGTQNIQYPMESSLLLYDGELEAGQLSTYSLNIDEVVLSACYAGWRPDKIGEEAIYGDEVLGIPGALMEAGVQTILFSVMPVGDQAARAFMSFYYENRLNKMQPLKAFQQAQISIYKKYPLKDWQGFVLYSIPGNE